MPKNTVKGIPTRTRLVVCDWLMDDVAYEEIRSRLAADGMPEDELPSDFCLRKYKQGEEYEKQYEARLVAHRMAHWDLPELDPSRDWQQLAADHGAARMTMLLSTTANVEMSMLVQMMRALTARESLAFRKERWEVEKADRLQAMRSARAQEQERLATRGVPPKHIWDLPKGLTLMDTARTLDRMEWMLVESPADCARLGLRAKVVQTLRFHYRLESTADVMATWEADVEEGLMAQTFWDEELTVSGTGEAYDAACMAALLADYTRTYGPLAPWETAAPVPAGDRADTETPHRNAQNVTESQGSTQDASPWFPTATTDSAREAEAQAADVTEDDEAQTTTTHRNAQIVTDTERPANPAATRSDVTEDDGAQTTTTHRNAQIVTDTERPANPAATRPDGPGPVFANSPSEATRAKARRQRKKGKKKKR